MKLKNEEKYYHKVHINSVPEQPSLNIFFELTKSIKTMRKPKQLPNIKIL